MSVTSFEIQHGWGDPREPEYRNGARVSVAHYKEGETHLFFSIYPGKLDGSEIMLLEVPPKIKISFANDWHHCELVIQRVIEFLESLNETTSHRKYDRLVIDTSKVPSWFTTQIALFEKNHTYLNDTLPDKNTTLFVVLGLALIFQCEYHSISILSTELASLMLIANGLLLLLLMLRDIFNRWIFFVRNPVLNLITSWTLKGTLAGTFNRYWRRYLLTFCLSVLFIGIGFKYMPNQALLQLLTLLSLR